MIRFGERLRFKSGDRWSHCGVFITPDLIVEALTREVCRTPASAYRNIDHLIVDSKMVELDRKQAVAFATSCVGQKYGWPTIFGIALRFLTPGRGLWFGANGTEICSGLVGQCMVRGWANFKVNPASMTPAELAEEYKVSDTPV